MCAQTHTCMRAQTHTCIGTHVHTGTHTGTHTHEVCMCMHAHPSTNTHTHTCTHTWAQPASGAGHSRSYTPLMRPHSLEAPATPLHLNRSQIFAATLSLFPPGVWCSSCHFSVVQPSRVLRGAHPRGSPGVSRPHSHCLPMTWCLSHPCLRSHEGLCGLHHCGAQVLST